MPSSPRPELRLGFRRHLRPEVVQGEATYLFSEHEITALSHPLLEVLAPLLDGSRGRAELGRDAPADLLPAHIDAVVAGLTEAGLIGATDTEPGFDPATLGEVAYWDAAGLDGASAQTRLATRTVEVVAVGDAPLDGLRRALTESGPALADRPGTGDLTIVACTDYLDPALRELDLRLRADARPWLLTRPVGSRLWVGPVFEPDGACWHCLERRLWDNRRAEAHVQARLGRSGPAARPLTGIGPGAAVAFGLIALEAAKWLAGYRDPGQQTIRTLDTFTLDGRRHEVRQRPQCSHCGTADLVTRRARQPVTLVERPATFTGGNGHRARSPQATLAAYGHLVDPLTGVVTDVRRDPRGPEFFNSFVAGANPAADGGLDGMRAALRSSSGGKGATAEQARVSALCEALERYSARSQGDECRVRGSYAELADDPTMPALHPDTCQLWDPQQFADRSRWNARHSPLQYVCEPFDADRVLDWTPVWSLTHEQHRLLPTGMLYFGAAAPGVRADSNGTAAGSSLEDAVLQGLLELIERDAVAIWWYDRSRVPGVDLASFDDPWLTELQAVHRSLGRQVQVLDVSADLGVPVFAAMSQQVDGDHETMFGFGAHLDARIALRRALTELNQMMPPLLDPARSADLGDPDIATWFATPRDALDHLVADPTLPARRASEFAAQSTLDLRADIGLAHDRLRGHGLELLVLDQTRPDLGLPVVKVIVPGLRSMWTRFAPGRLFDVPVRLGRRATALRLGELNPVPMFL